MIDQFVARRRHPRAHGAAHRSGRAARARTPRGADRPRRGGARRRTVEEGPRRCWRAGPARTSSCTSPPTPPAGSRHPVRITGAAPHWLRGDSATSGSRPPAVASPSGGLILHLAIVGPTASGKSELALRDRADARGRRDRVARLDAGVSGDGHRHGEAQPRQSAAGAAPRDRRRRAGRRLVGRPHPDRGACRGRRHRGARPGACSSAGPVSTCRPWSTRSSSPARTACARRARSATQRRPVESPARTQRSSPPTRWPPARIDPHNVRRIVRALEVIRLTGRPFSSFGPGVDAYGATRLPGSAWPGSGFPVHSWPSGSRPGSTAMRSRLVDEVGRRAAAPGGLSRTARRRSATRRCWPT